MQELALMAETLLFLALGLISPFVLSLGYVWVDTLLPQRLSYGLLSSLQLAFIMGAGAVLMYVLGDRRSPPRFTLLSFLCLLMAAWISLTTTWAVAPDAAWGKWDASVKTVLFCSFMPYVFRTRVQIEAFLMVFTFAAAGHLLPWGVKTMLTGGGYEMALGLMSVNSTMLAESSAVAAVTVMFIPLLIWMRTYSLLIPWSAVRLWGATGMTILYIIANIGTFARTGLVALGIVGSAMLVRSRRKVLFVFLALILGGIAFLVTSDRWTSRISTIADYQTESSAYVRILVWKWTVNFANSHPFGGGFNSYYTNVLSLPTPDGEARLLYGRAFHNIYMAALGEHGYPGLLLYVSILVLSQWGMQRTIRKTRDRPDLLWAADLCRAVQVGLAILMACGNFVDISFNYLVWNMIALGMCLNGHVDQVLNPRPSLADRARERAAALRGPAADPGHIPGAQPVSRLQSPMR